MKKLTMFGIVFIVMCSLASATVSRSGTDKIVTYSTTLSPGSLKAYWAVEETITGCTMSAVSCSTTNTLCGYTGGKIRVTGYSASTGGSMPTSIPVTITGSGPCTLNNGVYIESTSSVQGSQLTIPGSITLNLGTCIPMSNILTAITEWKARARTMDSLLQLTAQYWTSPC